VVPPRQYPGQIVTIARFAVIIVEPSEVHERAVPTDWRPNPFNLISYRLWQLGVRVAPELTTSVN
jgi:hypothetical protein